MCGGSWNVILLLWPPSPLPFHRDHRSECGIKSDFWWRQETGDFQYGFIPVWIGSKIFRPKWSVYAKFFGEKVVLGSSIVETVGSPSGREWTTMAQETWSRGRETGGGGAGWQGGGQKLSKRSRGKWQRQMNHNGARLLTRGRVDYQNLNWELKKTYSFELKLYFERKSDFSSILFLEKYVHKYHKQEKNCRSKSISMDKTKICHFKDFKKFNLHNVCTFSSFRAEQNLIANEIKSSFSVSSS